MHFKTSSGPLTFRIIKMVPILMVISQRTLNKDVKEIFRMIFMRNHTYQIPKSDNQTSEFTVDFSMQSLDSLYISTFQDIYLDRYCIACTGKNLTCTSCNGKNRRQEESKYLLVCWISSPRKPHCLLAYCCASQFLQCLLSIISAKVNDMET